MRLHQIQVVGRIGQDAKIIDSQNGKFMTFSLAVDESYKDRVGVKVEKTVWYDCTTNLERFTGVASYLTAGREVLVEGKPENSIYYNRENVAKLQQRIQIRNISLGNLPDPNRQQQPAAAAPAPQPAPAPTVPPVRTPVAGGDFGNTIPADTDLPF